ncbi:unnamed protein product [Linum trigynum]|uniref:Ubiquitin-like domain-containing protein n=1 Tax=Linum trigynum TaxID=586398 RepID=A0AAV2DNC3_9ROSI
MASAPKFKINGRTLAPEIQLPSPSATVLDLKQAIQSLLGVAVARQRLFHKGVSGELLNDRSIQSYKLKAEQRKGQGKSVVNLDLTVEPLPKKRRGEKISFVVKFGDEQATFNLRETDTVRDLEDLMFDRFKISDYKLRCAGAELPTCDDGVEVISLYEYYLSEGTVIEVASGTKYWGFAHKTYPPSYYNSQ